MAYAIVTSCTNRKRVTPSKKLCARDLSKGSLAAVTKQWSARIRTAKNTQELGKLYIGRGFQEARKAAETLKARHFVVSAGLGLITTDRHAPPYSLTISRNSEDCILKKLTVQATPSEWWTSLTKTQRTKVRLDRKKFSTVLVALPRDYLEMVSPTLLKLAKRGENLRILTRPDQSHIHKDLQRYCITYDNRLDGVGSKNAGTLSDFISRCAHHFAAEVLIKHPDLIAIEHQAKVKSLLSKFSVRKRPVREKRSDKHIKKIIEKDWNIVSGGSGKMLRRLRDHHQIACEQRRFKDLFHEVAETRLKS